MFYVAATLQPMEMSGMDIGAEVPGGDLDESMEESELIQWCMEGELDDNSAEEEEDLLRMYEQTPNYGHQVGQGYSDLQSVETSGRHPSVNQNAEEEEGM